MIYTDFTINEHGFTGHMADPERKTDQAVIVIMGGEKSILPGIKIAERFADFGICGLAVSLFGAEGLPKGPDRIPLDMFENAVRYLTEEKKMKSVSTYGVSMGSLFAAFGACIYRQPPKHPINQGFFETRKLNTKPYNHMVNAFSTLERAFFIYRA